MSDHDRLDEVITMRGMRTETVLRFGPFGHLDEVNFPHQRHQGQHRDTIRRMREEAWRNKEPFVLHFRKQYDEFPDLPLWAAAEIMSFGTVLTLLNMSDHAIRPAIASRFKLHDKVFASWLLTLNLARNICAHHSRLWNREIALKPLVPNKKNGPEWHDPFSIQNHRVFVVLTMLRVLQRQVAPRSRWHERLFSLFDSFPRVPLGPMGMPQNWREHSLWRQ